MFSISFLYRAEDKQEMGGSGSSRVREGLLQPCLPQAGIIYYSQEKYFHHVQQAAAKGLEKFSNDPVLQFFKAYGVFREGKDWSVLAS